MHLVSLLSCLVVTCSATVFYGIPKPEGESTYHSWNAKHWSYEVKNNSIELAIQNDILHVYANGLKAFWSPEGKYEWEEVTHKDVLPPMAQLVLVDYLTTFGSSGLKALIYHRDYFSHGHYQGECDLQVRMHPNRSPAAFGSYQKPALYKPFIGAMVFLLALGCMAYFIFRHKI